MTQEKDEQLLQLFFLLRSATDQDEARGVCTEKQTSRFSGGETLSREVPLPAICAADIHFWNFPLLSTL